MKEQDILERFAELSSEAIITEGKHTDLNSVFLPGKRADRALLVAHVDTIQHDSKELRVSFGGPENPMFFSGTRRKGVFKKTGKPFISGLGIGADDRAGCAMLWALKDLGHSLLLTNGEEHGCLGSRYLMSSKKMAMLIQQHQFALQFDRKGRDDLVFYNVGTQEFADYLVQQTGYSIAEGTYTDICVLCEQMCGCNISVGYSGEHTANEMLNLRYWIKTFEVAHNLLSQPQIPKFGLKNE